MIQKYYVRTIYTYHLILHVVNEVELSGLYDWMVVTINDPDLLVPSSAVPDIVDRFLPGWNALHSRDVENDWLLRSIWRVCFVYSYLTS